MKIKQAVTLFSSLVLSSSVLAASQSDERWFDIEVILISQLADKSDLKEIFANDAKLPSFKKPLDLLTPYLTPDVSHLKQTLPFCNSENQHIQYHDNVQLPSIVTIKPLATITKEIEKAISIADGASENNSKTLLTNEAVVQEQSYQNDDFYDRVLTEKEKISETAHKQESLNNINNLSNQLTDVEPTISAEQIALVNAAQQHFSPIQFDYTNTTFEADQEHLLCQITKDEFESLAPDQNRYSYLGFPVHKVPEEISATEDLYNPNPYLLNNDSLALNSIVKQLKRSKDFRPLLHIGWRQPVSSRRHAIPIKLFAGDNLQQDYLEQLKLYQQQKTQVMSQEQSLNSILFNDLGDESVLTEQEQLIQNKEKRLTNIINQLSTITEDTPTLISELEQVPPPLQIDEMLSKTLMTEPPLAPIQPWYLQGFMQIYINSNNRLNIIADFNMLNLTLSEQETIKRRPNAELNLQTIPFKQRRQVISTEIHYFDHPYLGMIVQIRRHQRPEAPTENIE